MVCRDERLGREPEALVLTCAALVLGDEREARFAEGRVEDLESVVERRLDFEGEECRAEEVDVRGVEVEEEGCSE